VSYTTWTPREVSSEAEFRSAETWRIVEGQHFASTMKLVDSTDEQDALEALLEESKPSLPPSTAKFHYLLVTPFRYPPPRRGSRFRGENDPGVFYGAGSVRAAAAELGYRRWQFLRDAVELERLEPIAHTVFRIAVATATVDLRKAPFSKDAAYWSHPTDYSATQAFARVAREAGIGGIAYQSVRDPRLDWCMAVLTPRAFAARNPDFLFESWWLAVRQDAAIWRGGSTSFIFPAACWAVAGR